MPSPSSARNKDQSNRHRAAGPSSCADRTAADQARFCSLRRSPTDPSARAPKRRRTAPDGPPAHNRRPPPARVVSDQLSKDENVGSCLKGNQIRPENATTSSDTLLVVVVLQIRAILTSEWTPTWSLMAEEWAFPAHPAPTQFPP